MNIVSPFSLNSTLSLTSSHHISPLASLSAMEGLLEDDFLCLGLSIVADSRCERERKKKRKRDETPNSNISDSTDQSYGEEGKLFSLFQIRDQMLKLDHHKKEDTNEVDEDGKGLHLIHLLLVSSTSVDTNDVTSSLENLSELYRNVSLTGDSVQRMAAYFADGLIARLLTRESPFHNMIMKGAPRDEEFMAFTDLYKVSPFYQFAHFTANQAILEAFEKHQHIPEKKALHVIDFNVSYGLQWPSLMQSLSENATTSNRTTLKLTGFGRNSQELQETESRLVSFARAFRNLNFEFHGIVRGSKLSKPKIKKGDIVAANLVFHLSTLNGYSKCSETLSYIRSLSPSIVVVVEREGSRKSGRNFLSRFMESLHYYAAIFDSLNDCLPADSAERLRIEKDHLGREIKQAMNFDRESGDCMRFESREIWKGRMENHGFTGVRQSLKGVMQAKLLLKMRSHCCSVDLEGENGGFRVFEGDDGNCMSLGWQEKLLITASSWSCG